MIRINKATTGRYPFNNGTKLPPFQVIKPEKPGILATKDYELKSIFYMNSSTRKSIRSFVKMKKVQT